jgi:glycosyltransferase involved in cell wall biosynthesis
MKILCVIDSLGSGGAQRQLVELAKGFKEKGHQVSFLIYHNVIFYNDLKNNDIPVFCVSEKYYLLRLIKMRKFIRNGKFNIVLSFLEASNFICSVSGFPVKKWKLIVGERSANPKISKSLKLIVYRWFHVFADYVVANSIANLEMVNKINPFLSDSKCKVIYNVINPSSFSSKASVKHDSNQLHIVVGASHQYLKNAKGMLKAILKLSKEQKDRLRISWYGDRTSPPFFDNSFLEANTIVSENNLNETVKFYPATNDFLEIMGNADVVGLFSLYEGLPNLVCEGMALGKPIMSSNVSDIPLLLQHTPNQIFDPNKIDEIKTVFEYYLGLKGEEFLQIGIQNKIVAKENFNKAMIIEQYLNLMK